MTANLPLRQRNKGTKTLADKNRERIDIASSCTRTVIVPNVIEASCLAVLFPIRGPTDVADLEEAYAASFENLECRDREVKRDFGP